MHEHRFHGDIARLRSPERLAWLEVGLVVEYSIRGRNIQRVLDEIIGNLTSWRLHLHPLR